MQFFYSKDTESNLYTLSEEESKHCVKVLRMEIGAEINVVDGHGTLCRCRIAEAHPKHCEVEVVERVKEYGKRSFRLHVAVAPTKNTARMEWFIEKAVEIGIDEITPIVCDHSERCILKQERMEKIAVSAMKQSLKAYLPVINAPTPLTSIINNISAIKPSNLSKYIAYCDGENRTPLREAYTQGSDALILIGPEGDFSPEEVRLALKQGFKPVTLGECRLRTETAALAATTFFNLMN